MTNPWLAAVPLFIGALALFFAARNYLRKSGVLVRGNYCITSSVSCDDRYISSIALENLKDRALTIFAIYLRIGCSYYIKIEDREDEPLILRPFETYKRSYGPIEFYEFSMKRVGFDHLLEDKHIPKRLVLSTGEGKYVVPSLIPMWHPVSEYFKNHMTILADPARSRFAAQDMGGNVKYTIEPTGTTGKQEIITLHEQDFSLKVFRDFLLTEESLSSRDKLESFLNDQVKAGHLHCQKLTVYDADALRKEKYAQYNLSVYQLPKMNWFQYHLLGRFYTFKADREIVRKNREIQDGRKST